jgi:hypothetical protein
MSFIFGVMIHLLIFRKRNKEKNKKKLRVKRQNS